MYNKMMQWVLKVKKSQLISQNLGRIKANKNLSSTKNTKIKTNKHLKKVINVLHQVKVLEIFNLNL